MGFNGKENQKGFEWARAWTRTSRALWAIGSLLWYLYGGLGRFLPFETLKTAKRAKDFGGNQIPTARSSSSFLKILGWRARGTVYCFWLANEKRSQSFGRATRDLGSSSIIWGKWSLLCSWFFSLASLAAMIHIFFENKSLNLSLSLVYYKSYLFKWCLNLYLSICYALSQSLLSSPSFSQCSEFDPGFTPYDLNKLLNSKRNW